ncbi:LOW QUALITY PROTEIN: hypothetical protein NC651_017790 [Populus alba x Populus x berolinensis]|nr:LOW QUALITY PROTEIN: hypothetical protein NC651_017790 [Populus alba x Populus x berolinensis]
MTTAARWPAPRPALPRPLPARGIGGRTSTSSRTSSTTSPPAAANDERNSPPSVHPPEPRRAEGCLLMSIIKEELLTAIYSEKIIHVGFPHFVGGGRPPHPAGTLPHTSRNTIRKLLTENVDQSDSPNFLPGPSPLPQSCLLLNGSELFCPLRGPQPATELEELHLYF